MHFLKILLFMTTASLFAQNQNPKVVVIGAGIAGLTTAHRLQQAGMNVNLYEARSRVGGRIFTVSIGGHPVELGGQNITDGGEAENMRRLIDEFGLELTTTRWNMNFSYFNGEALIPSQQLFKSQQLPPHELKAKLDQLAAQSQNMKEILDGLFEENDPLYKVTAVRLAAYEGGTIDKLSPLYTETLFHMLLGGICSVYQGNGEEETYFDLVKIKGGNALLTQKMAEALGPRLNLNMPLTQVLRNSDRSFKLTFQGGQQVNADILVLAIPCSVYDKIEFGENTVAQERLESIKSVQYGMNAKIAIPLSKNTSKNASLISDSSISFIDNPPNVLFLYFSGGASQFSESTIQNAYSQSRPMLEAQLGEECPPFIAPQVAEDRAFASYDVPVGYSWPNDPYAKGTYSYISAGQETLLMATHEEKGERVRSLFAPIDEKLFFAGEHASILMDAPGTMEAACESGERTARMILETQPRHDPF